MTIEAVTRTAMAGIVAPSATDAPEGQRSMANDPLWRAAKSFEAVFMAEMMNHAGADAGRESMGGGYAEKTFQSLLARAWAEAAAEKGGIGLAKHIYEAMRDRV